MRILDPVLRAVAAGRSLWVELELPDLSVSPPDGVQPVADPLHCTLLFLGKGRSPAQVERCADVVRYIAETRASFESRVGGQARFAGGAREGDPYVWLLSSTAPRRLRRYLVDQLGWPTPPDDDSWDYTPHVTVGRVPRDSPLTLHPVSFPSLSFRSIALCAGEARVSHTLGAPRA